MNKQLERLEHLEMSVAALKRRVASLEAPHAEAAPAAKPAPPARAAKPSAPAPKDPLPFAPSPAITRTPAPVVNKPRPAPDPVAAPEPRRTPLTDFVSQRSVEDILGGSVLAWLGGLAVLIGVAFLFAVGVSRGWIGEGARTLFAAAGSSALVVAGVWLHERRSRTEAALAAVSAGIAALFLTATVATRVYGLVPDMAGITLLLAVGAVATTLALRWESKGIAALGILGAMVSPVLAGAPASFATVAILAIAGAAGVGVLLRQRWDWLSFGVVAIALPQWLTFIFDSGAASGAVFVTVGAFGALGVLAAAGYEIRVRAERLRGSSSLLLGANALIVSVAGWIALGDMGAEVLAAAWLWVVAAAHIGLGLWVGRGQRTSHDFSLLTLTIGAVLADAAFAASVSGPARALGFAGGAVLFAALVRRRGAPPADGHLAATGLGVHVALALVQTLTASTLPALNAAGGPDAGLTACLLAVASACLVSGRLVGPGRRDLQMAVDTVGLSVVVYITALSLEGTALAFAYAAEAVALARIGARGDEVSQWGARVVFALAFAVAVDLAPPDSVTAGLGDHALQDLAALAACVGSAVMLARLDVLPEIRHMFRAIAIALAAYLAAVALDGVWLILAYSAGAVGLAFLGSRGDEVSAWGARLLLAVGVIGTVAQLAPPEALATGLGDRLVPGVVALVACAAAALACARFDGVEDLRDSLDGMAILLVAYLAAVVLDGALLTVALAGGAIVLAYVGRRFANVIALGGAAAALAAAALQGLVVEASPVALVNGLGDPAAALLGLSAVALSAAVLAGHRPGIPSWSPVLRTTAGVTALYLASVVVVTPFQPDGLAAGATLLDLPVRDQGQVWLSALWCMVGLSGVVVGLRRDISELRAGALGLLLLAVAKVFLFDLANLTSVYRVMSFIGLGLFLLVAAFAWQRMRPRPLQDLREAPEGIR